jgi:hypothetical protein
LISPDGLDRQDKPAFARMLGDELAIGRVNRGHHRRLVFGQPIESGSRR